MNHTQFAILFAALALIFFVRLQEAKDGRNAVNAYFFWAGTSKGQEGAIIIGIRMYFDSMMSTNRWFALVSTLSSLIHVYYAQR